MITFDSVRKEYGEFVAVDQLNLEISQGEIYGLIGPNGAGKTTTIRMGCGLLNPTAGRILIEGIDIYRQPEVAQQYIGYLSDVYALYDDLTAWEYLDYFAHAYRMPASQIPARITEVIRLVGLEIKEHEFIKGLSRGMRQRLGLARSILHRPKLLLLDEPASGLDPKARIDLQVVLRSLRDQGTTILISSHILTDLEGFCTAIGIMERGRLIRSESLASLAQSIRTRRKLQLRWTGDGRETVASVLGGIAEVADIELSDGSGVFAVEGDDQILANILEQLMSRHVRVVEFVGQKHTVQDIYMQVSRHEVM